MAMHTERALLDLLSDLECQLHRSAVRSDAAAVERLLHAQFREIGRSGRHYDRAAMVALLAAEDPADSAFTVHAQDFSLQMLSDDAALLSYRSAHRQADGQLSRPTWRTSIWRHHEAQGWQLLFHQGTPTQAF